MAGKTPLWPWSFPRETLEFEYNWTDRGCKFVRITRKESARDLPPIREATLLVPRHRPQKTSVFAVYDVDLDAAERD